MVLLNAPDMGEPPLLTDCLVWIMLLPHMLELLGERVLLTGGLPLITILPLKPGMSGRMLLLLPRPMESISGAGCLLSVMLLPLIGLEVDARTLLPLGPEVDGRNLLRLGLEIEERVLPALGLEIEECMPPPLGRENGVRILLPFGSATGECILLPPATETCGRMSTPPPSRVANLSPGVLDDDWTIFENPSGGASTTMLGGAGAEVLFVCLLVGAGRAKGFRLVARRFPCCRSFVAVWRRCGGGAETGPMDSSHHLGKERLPMMLSRVSKLGISCLNLHPCCAK